MPAGDPVVRPETSTTASGATVTVPSVEDVRAVLAKVVDPELGADLVELGMVESIDIGTTGLVEVTVALTIVGCPMRTQIRDDAAARIRALPGVSDVQIHFGVLTAAQRTQVMQRARWKARDRAPETEIPGTTRILAIASGKGGVGKSSITCNLAAAMAARGLVVGVLDADIWGYSVPRMLGMEERLSAIDGKIDPAERLVDNPNGEPGRLRVVSMGLVVDDEDKAIMWRGLMLAKAVEEFLTKVRWGPLDYLLIDMPPGTGDVQMALARLLPRAELLIVTTPGRSAQRVAVRAADMARRGYLRIAGVVENMSYFECDHGSHYALFGEGGGQALADETGAALVARIPLAPSIASGGDTGEPAALVTDGPAAAAFASLADLVVRELVPPLAMDGCSARLVTALEAAVPPAPTPART